MRKKNRKSFDFLTLLLVLILAGLALFVWKFYPQFTQPGFNLSDFFPPSLSDLGASISSGLGKFGGH
jgi:hypothetical protein